jgi:hypothetical protein
MATVKYGALVTEIRGSIGGTTFQKNAYGQTIKNKAILVRPNSERQENVKNIFSAAVKAWRAFSDAARGNWNTFATNFPQFTKKDDTVTLTGFNAFVKWQSALYLGAGFGSLPQGTPVTSLPALDTANPTLEYVGASLELIQNFVTADGTWLVNWFISSPRLDSQLFFGSQRRFIVSGLTSIVAFDITNTYFEIFGVLPQVGEPVNVSMVLYTLGGGVVLAPVNFRVIVS